MHFREYNITHTNLNTISSWNILVSKIIKNIYLLNALISPILWPEVKSEGKMFRKQEILSPQPLNMVLYLMSPGSAFWNQLIKSEHSIHNKVKQTK
jgi:hypothetical protein